MNTDTIRLLRECDAGSKMAIAAIDEVVEQVKDETLLQLLAENKAEHEKIKNEIHARLDQVEQPEKEPNPIAEGMSWLKTNFKLSMGATDQTIADLITDGCNMGVKSLNRYLNQYAAADEEAKGLCRQLIDLEETLERKLRNFL